MQNIQLEKIITSFFKETGIYSGEISFTYDDDTNMMWCVITTPGGRLLTGKNGETLAAINHLVRKIIEKELGFAEDSKQSPWNVMVDINGFQKKHVDSVKAIAHMMAERARFFKSSIEVDPMSAFDRRIVHEFVSSMSDLKTESIGDGVKRRVVIKYTGGESSI